MKIRLLHKLLAMLLHLLEATELRAQHLFISLTQLELSLVGLLN